MSTEKKESKFFYGWVIAGCCMFSVCAASLLSTGMSTNLNAMRQVLGLTNTQTSLILTVRSISAFVAAVFAGRYYRFLGVKKGMLLAMGAGIAAFLVFTVAGTNMLLNYTAGAIAGICYAYGMMMPASMLLRRWFNKARGTALSIASCGTGFVSIIFAPLVQSTVNGFGIKTAFLLQAGVLFVVAVIMAILIVETPEEKGLEPLGGYDWVPDNSGKKVREETSLSGGWYFGLIIATALIGMSASPCSANFTNNLVTAGFNNMDVAKALSIYGFVLIVSKMLFGRCVDRFGTRNTTALFGVLCTLGMLCMVLVTRVVTVPFMYAALIVIGVGCVVQTLGYPNWCVDLDSKHYNHSLVRCQTGYQLGCVVGSPIPGILADATGSYAPAYVMFTVCTILAMLIVLGAYRAQEKKA